MDSPFVDILLNENHFTDLRAALEILGSELSTTLFNDLARVIAELVELTMMDLLYFSSNCPRLHGSKRRSDFNYGDGLGTAVKYKPLTPLEFKK